MSLELFITLYTVVGLVLAILARAADQKEKNVGNIVATYIGFVLFWPAAIIYGVSEVAAQWLAAKYPKVFE